ncbi:MAG: hypothetical protein RBT41_07695 [Clostridia bacterium]|jgi:hypothetical protein|nr:hypothetical protein [Clostridia bacterium]
MNIQLLTEEISGRCSGILGRDSRRDDQGEKGGVFRWSTISREKGKHGFVKETKNAYSFPIFQGFCGHSLGESFENNICLVAIAHVKLLLIFPNLIS